MRLLSRIARVTRVAVALFLVACTGGLFSGCRHDRELTGLDQGSPSISVDGTQLVFARIGGGESFLVVYDRQKKQARRLTPKGVQAYEPIWSARQGLIIFTRVEEHYHHLWSVHSDGSEMKRITDGPFIDNPLVTSPDGAQVYFVRENWTGRFMLPLREVWKADLAPPQPRVSLVGLGTSISSDGQKRAFESKLDQGIYLFSGSQSGSNFICHGYAPGISPDGVRLAYVRITTNWDKEIWVRNLAAGTERLVYSAHPHFSQPLFSLNSQEVAIRQLIPEPPQPDIVIFSLANRQEERIAVEAVY
jgi:Tol biopolymer transport system component